MTDEAPSRLPALGGVAGFLLGVASGAGFSADAMASGFANLLRMAFVGLLVAVLAVAATASRPVEHRLDAALALVLARTTTVVLVAAMMGTVLDGVHRVYEGPGLFGRLINGGRLGVYGFALGAIAQLVLACIARLPRTDGPPHD